MSAKHVTVEGLAAALHAAGVRCSPNIVYCRASHRGHAERILAALPDDCPAGRPWSPTRHREALAAAEADADNLYDALAVLLGARHPSGDADACDESACRFAIRRLAAYDRRVRGRRVPLAAEQAASEEPSSKPRRLDR